jgi:pimeloyl-ACP methyl ester carboxylesterase
MAGRRFCLSINVDFFKRGSGMIKYTHQTVPTQYIQASGIRFAYRRFGDGNSAPLLFNRHFTGTRDHWDPAITDGLAQGWEVILFDNAGILNSSVDAFSIPLHLRKRT